jgi:hypothetical protein
MMATQGTYGWELPDLSDVADGPDAFQQFADDVATTIGDRVLATYTPSWVSEGPAQPTNPSKREGFYRIDNGVCTFAVHLYFGASTSGGTGKLSIGLPVPATSVISSQQVMSHLWTPSANAVWHGPAFIDSATNWLRARPYFPVNNARSDMFAWASGAGDFGLPIPTIPSNPGSWNVMNGGDITLNGSYFIA